MNNSDWCVYMVRCADNSLYTGISNDVDKRVEKHNTGKGSKSIVKSKRPVQIVYTQKFDNRSDASKREAAIKALKRQDKLNLISS